MGAIFLPTDAKGPFFNLEGAADYCGWSARYFAKLIRDYRLPRYGPRKNKFSRVDLDRFMADPDNFKAEPPSRRRRKPMTLVVPNERAL